MRLELTRKIFTANSTIGELTINGSFECYILEDVDRGLIQTMPLHELAAIKVHGKTAIPYGRYEIINSYSNRFKKLLPLLLEVPGYDGIRIHAGNFPDDTEGCLLPGQSHSANMVGESQLAFKHLFNIMLGAHTGEKIFIEIKKQLTT
jgi:hypothetical protein